MREEGRHMRRCMGEEYRGREERKEHEGGRETYEGAWEWRIEGGKRGKNMREEGRHEGAWEWRIEGGKRGGRT